MSRQHGLLTFALLTLLVVPAFAGDLRPPDYRFDPLSTVAGWDFLTDQDLYSIRPDADMPLWIGDAAEPLKDKFPAGAPYPSAAIFGDVAYTPDNGGGYFASSSGENGLVFIVPNWLQPWMEEEPFKVMRLQVTYQGAKPPTAAVGYEGIPGSPTEIVVAPFARVPVNDASLPAGASFFYEDWLFSSSPAWEQVIVLIPEETIILHVVIDTVAVWPSLKISDLPDFLEIGPWPPPFGDD